MADQLSRQTTPQIKPIPGWILAVPYIIPDSIFTSVKEVSGESQKSQVIAVGEDLIDDNGIGRKPNCKIGDIVVHKWLSEDFNIGTIKYRFIHFADVRGIWLDAKRPKGEE